MQLQFKDDILGVIANALKKSGLPAEYLELEMTERLLFEDAPKTKEILNLIKQIDLYFPLNETTVSQVKLNEPSGDYTKIIFKNKLLNAKIDDSVFSN